MCLHTFGLRDLGKPKQRPATEHIHILGATGMWLSNLCNCISPFEMHVN